MVKKVFPAFLELMFSFRIILVYFLVPCKNIPTSSPQLILLNPILVPRFIPFLGELCSATTCWDASTGSLVPTSICQLSPSIPPALSWLLVWALCIHNGLSCQSGKIYEVFMDLLCFLPSVSGVPPPIWAARQEGSHHLRIVNEQTTKQNFKLLAFKSKIGVLKEIL